MRLWTSLAFLCISSWLPAISMACNTEIGAHQGIKICYKNKSKLIEITNHNKIWHIKLNGYSISEPFIFPLKGGGSVIGFVDLQGFSVGGAARLFYANGNVLKQDCSNSGLYANYLKIFSRSNTVYVALMNHVIKNYYDAGSIVRISKNGWAETSDQEAWDVLIKEYDRQYRKGIVDRGTYYSSLVVAYAMMKKSGLENKYLSLLVSKTERSANDTLAVFRKAVDKAATNLKSGGWCAVAG